MLEHGPGGCLAITHTQQFVLTRACEPNHPYVTILSGAAAILENKCKACGSRRARYIVVGICVLQI